MPREKSRDGVYIISAPDNAKTGRQPHFDEKVEHDKVQEVFLEVVEGREGNLLNLARAITFDCFSYDGKGLNLLAWQLRCNVKAGENEYRYIVPYKNNLDDIIQSIDVEIKL